MDWTDLDISYHRQMEYELSWRQGRFSYRKYFILRKGGAELSNLLFFSDTVELNLAGDEFSCEGVIPDDGIINKYI